LSASGRTLVTVNADFSLTGMERGQGWDLHQLPWTRALGEPTAASLSHAAAYDLAFFRERSVFVSEGGSGRVALIELPGGEQRSAFDVNRTGFHDSFTGGLALDAARNVLYVADHTNRRVVAVDTRLGVIDAKPRGILASVMLDGRPSVLVLSTDRKKLYVAETESDAMAVIDVSEPSAAKVGAVVHIGGPAGVTAAGDRVYVSNSRDDSIAVVAANRVEAEIPIRISGFEHLRGVAPAGLAYDPKTGWLLVAESGINALGVVDVRSSKVLGHIPAGWFPTNVLIDRGTVYVVNRRGQGVGPSVVVGSGFVRTIGEEGTAGSVSIFPVPSLADLAGNTELVMQAAGFEPRNQIAPHLPKEIRHVVLIVSASRAFDEMLGDVRRAGNGPVDGAAGLARFGSAGFVDGHRVRLSLHDVDVTPNHHAIARQWAFSDNFYAVSGGPSESPAAIWEHLKHQGISLFDGAAESADKSSDSERAQRVIREINERYVETGKELPQLVYIGLPNGRLAKPRPEAGFPYEESFIVDNDNAVGRIVEFLSRTKWWRNMAVFVTADSAEGGADHVDANRTVLLCAGPWSKRNYVSHVNSSFSGLWKTAFELLDIPVLNLSEASAADLSDCFAPSEDRGGYQGVPVDKRVFDPGGK